MTRHMNNKFLSLLPCVILLACSQIPQSISFPCTGIASINNIEALAERSHSKQAFDLWADRSYIDSCVFRLPEGLMNNETVKKVATMANWMVVTRYLTYAHDIAKRLEENGIDWYVKTEPMISALPLLFNNDETVRTLREVIALLGENRVEESGELFRPIAKAFYGDVNIVTQEEIQNIQENFWEMYDKKKYVPDIDLLQANRPDYLSNTADTVAVKKIRERRLHASSIDEYAIYAIEENIYARFNDITTLDALGGIIEAREYTPFLAEVYFNWRPTVQDNYFGLSKDSVIPNSYYDAVRTVCIETFARHIADNPDDLLAKTLCANILFQGALKRNAWIGGNECSITEMDITSKNFLQTKDEKE